MEEERQDGLLEIQKTFNADLLVLKEEIADESEDTEGEAAEQ